MAREADEKPHAGRRHERRDSIGRGRGRGQFIRNNSASSTSSISSSNISLSQNHGPAGASFPPSKSSPSTSHQNTTIPVSSLSTYINGQEIQINLNGFNYLEVKQYIDKTYKESINSFKESEPPEYHRNNEKAWSNTNNKALFMQRGATMMASGKDFFQELAKHKSTLLNNKS